MDQQALIDSAHASRINDRLPSGITTLTFAGKPFTDEGVALLLDQRPDLEGLFLIKTQVTDACIPTINQFPNLSEVNLNCTKITAKGLAGLYLPRLKSIALTKDLFSVESARALAGLPSLTHVELGIAGGKKTGVERKFDIFWLSHGSLKGICSLPR